MSLFGSTSTVALLIGVVQTVTLSTEDFSGSTATWSWNTPGVDDPGAAFTQTAGSTPSGSTGPNGGANAITQAVEPSNSYGFTEASGEAGPWTAESPEFDASLGTLTLTIDIHMRFGSEGGIDDGTMEIQGWNGSAWSTLSNAIVGSQQTSADDAWRSSTEFGAYTSSGFSNGDFKFRVRCTKGASSLVNNYDFAIDNAKITGPGLAQPTLPPAGTARAIALLLGNRTIFVATNGSNSNSGLSVNLPKRTIQNAVSLANRGDVVLIEDGDYFESFSITNSGATVAEPILIAARNAGQVRVLNLIEDALNGTASWTSRGGGVFSLDGASERSFLGYEVANGNFIPGYRSNSDITASSMSTNVGANPQQSSTNKPPYGMSFGSGQLRVRLKNGSNPTGQKIALTDGFNQTQFSINNSPNTIVDGIIFDGGGDGFSVSLDTNSENCVLTNCKIFTCQFGVRPGPNLLLDNCEFSQIGITQFKRDLLAEPGNGEGSTAIFRYAKNHYVGDIVGSNTADALIEGGFLGGQFSTAGINGIRMTECWLHDAFEGSKPGRSRNVEVDNCRFENIMDDAMEWEASGTIPGSDSGTNLCHDNRITNCEVAFSMQSPALYDNLLIYRNLVEVTDQGVTRMPFVFKTSGTPDNANIQIYHNTFKHISDNDETTEGFGTHNIFFPFSAGSGSVNGGLRVGLFRNNCIIFEDLDFSNNQPPTASIQNNTLANDDNSAWRANGGEFVGAESALNLDANFVPAANSPLVGAGGGISGSLPDSRSEQTTVGCHELGAIIDTDWPRPAAEFFRDTSPPRWTEPGGV